MTARHAGKGLNVVEFFGVPGVGKSYLAKNAVPPSVDRPMDRFSEGIRIQRISRKVLLMLRHLPSAVAAGLWATRLTDLFPSMHWHRHIKVLFNWMFIDCVIREAARCGNPTLVLDQGIVQALWSTQFGANDCPADELRALLQQYHETLPITKWKVVRVIADMETVRQRVDRREGCSPVDLDLELINKAHSAELQISELLDGFAFTSTDAPQITIVTIVNNDESAVSRLRELMGWV